MADITNILAMGPQPTTQWQNPLEMEAKRQQIRQSQAAIKEAEQLSVARQYDMDRQRQADARAEAQRQAWIKAGQEARTETGRIDPDKFTSIYLNQTGDQAGANAALKAMADYKESLAKAGKETAALHAEQSKRVAGLLEGVLNQPGQMRQGAYRQAQILAQNEGLDLPNWVNADAVQTLRDLHLVQGTLAEEHAKAAAEQRAAEELAIKQAQEARAADKFATEQPVDAAIAAATLADPNLLTPEQRQKAEDDMLTGNFKDYLLAVPKSKRAEIPFDKWLDSDANRKRPVNNVNVGTFQLAEDSEGKPIMWNTKTGEVRDANGIQKTGTTAKAEEKIKPVKDALAYADEYVNSKAYTGAGDEALMEKFFDLAKPSSGFRMTQAQMDMLKHSQDLLGSAEATIRHATVGTWFSEKQRQEIAKTMRDIAKAKGVGGESKGVDLKSMSTEDLLKQLTGVK